VVEAGITFPIGYIFVRGALLQVAAPARNQTGRRLNMHKRWVTLIGLLAALLARHPVVELFVNQSELRDRLRERRRRRAQATLT
jgi:hypothetical protein